MGSLQKSQAELTRIAFGEMFPELSKEKTRNRAFSILEAAIENYATEGIENTTYEKIAKKAGVSRPLIFKYFDDYEAIFYKAVKLIRVHFQVYAVERINAAKSPTEKLRAYVESTFGWLKDHPAYASSLVLYLQRCSWSERDRDLNTQFTETGSNRIAALIRLGIEENVFSSSDPAKAAKQIQTIITGAVITSLSEDIAQRKAFEQSIVELCLSLVEV